MSNNNNTWKENDDLTLFLEKGFWSEKIFIQLRDKYLFARINSIRCFKVSLRRIRCATSLRNDDEVKKMIASTVDNIFIDNDSNNEYFLNLSYGFKTTQFYDFKCKIKLKEIDEYIDIKKTDSSDVIIKKQNEKILLLLNKIKSHKLKHKDLDLNTDDEFII